MRLFFAISFLIFWSLDSASFTNTPIVAIHFANAYNDISIIKNVLDKKGKEGEVIVELTQEHLKFFDQKNTTLDQKIALVNAIGWGKSNNIQIYRKHLELKYHLNTLVLDSVLTDPLYPGEEFCFNAKKITAQELCLLGYIQVMGNHDRPMLAYKAAYEAALSLPTNHTANIIIALILAQAQAEYDWCSSYLHMKSLREDARLVQDRLRKGAIDSIYAYFDSGASKCNTPVHEGPDAALLTTQNESPLFNSVVFHDEASNGTRIHVLIMNKGSEIFGASYLEIIFRDEEMEGGKYVFRDKLPEIQPGETIDKDIIIPEYKTYRPNTEFKITIDPDHLIPETNEDNNVASFYEQG